MFVYPVNLVPDGDGWLVTFPDIPEAITSAPSKEEAMCMAQDALETAIEFYFEDGRSVPMPSKVKKGQDIVELPMSVSAKVYLLNEMILQRVRPAELARRMGTRPQDVNRIVDLHHQTKIDTIASALRSLGKRLDLTLA